MCVCVHVHSDLTLFFLHKTMVMTPCLPLPSSSSGEGALYVIHVALNNSDEEGLLSALSDPNAGLPHTHRSEEGRRLYMSALLKEKAKRAPRAILVGAVMWSTASVEEWVCYEECVV